ncbi:MAG: J domain-containing protein [Anaerolineae bacterium]|nr:J domain-containing protein [Anaerolineae bacterium]
MIRHYNLLGLTKEATLSDAKVAYRKLARENHPDLHPAEKEKYTLRMAQINAAFEAIRKTLETD